MSGWLVAEDSVIPGQLEQTRPFWPMSLPSCQQTSPSKFSWQGRHAKANSPILQKEKMEKHTHFSSLCLHSSYYYTTDQRRSHDRAWTQWRGLWSDRAKEADSGRLHKWFCNKCFRNKDRINAAERKQALWDGRCWGLEIFSRKISTVSPVKVTFGKDVFLFVLLYTSVISNSHNKTPDYKFLPPFYKCRNWSSVWLCNPKFS